MELQNLVVRQSCLVKTKIDKKKKQVYYREKQKSNPTIKTPGKQIIVNRTQLAHPPSLIYRLSTLQIHKAYLHTVIGH